MLAAFAVFLFGFATASCSVPSATVYFSADGQIVAEAEVTETSGLELFEPETDDGRYFVGWYADEAFTEPFDYHRYIVNDFPEDIVIYALFVDGDPDVCAHELRHIEGKAPSCVEAGSAEYWHCALCGKNFATEDCLTEIDTVILAPTGHDLVFVPEKDASCTEGGNAQHWFCPSCGKYFLDEDATTETDDPGIPALSHLPVYVAEVSPACDEDGTAEHWKCARCALTFSDASCMTPVKDGDLVIPAPGHSFGERTISSAPDETSAGKVVSVCSACGDARTETVPALSDRDFYSVSETPSSCSEHGYRIYSFVLDGEALYVREPLPLADHVPAAPSGAFDNSCTENGYTGDVLCEVCGAMLSEGVTVPAKGHSYDDGVVTVKPSCGHKGECVFTCSECGDTDVRELAPLPHSLEYFSELLPTCTQDGHIAYNRCSHCGKYFTEDGRSELTEDDLIVSAYGHDLDDNGVCSRCGKLFTVGIVYELRGNGYYAVGAELPQGTTEIVVPETYEGLPVIGIASYAFTNYADVVSITIPDSVAEIGDDAFAGCDGVTALTVPFVGNTRDDEEFSIGSWFGVGSSNASLPLTSVTLTSATRIPSGAFSQCINLSSVDLNAGVTHIGDMAFFACISLTSVTLPDGVIGIGSQAFRQCVSLSALRLPQSAEEIGSDAFASVSDSLSVTFAGSEVQWEALAEHFGDNVTVIYE